MLASTISHPLLPPPQVNRSHSSSGVLAVGGVFGCVGFDEFSSSSHRQNSLRVAAGSQRRTRSVAEILSVCGSVCLSTLPYVPSAFCRSFTPAHRIHAGRPSPRRPPVSPHAVLAVHDLGLSPHAFLALLGLRPSPLALLGLRPSPFACLGLRPSPPPLHPRNRLHRRRRRRWRSASDPFFFFFPACRPGTRRQVEEKIKFLPHRCKRVCL